MQSNHPVWLAQLARDKKGGKALPSITRGQAYTASVGFPVDVSGDSFAGQLRLSPDAAGDPLADFTVTPGDYADGSTIVTLSLSAGQTGALPADGDADGLEEVVFEVLRNGARCFAGNVFVSGRVAE
ncbi:hypothetical protein [Alteriqipengyuania lutimaris]|uniref:Uncharacterized protein n=1 Tax=Alteriqipengyuania lutimaris TaxID=1538146 RepID=A0A395LKG0_9SPHN|nr:hypothetical protein [Alteriqipengyuania lutimaris]MBB3035370.1 hypothetical protein [Alteriqipengyuania lutimaris]RDS75954.1 hypothetical protein DL238_14880 [Alteriqipengyuania lutimaris]